jgi:hypothetical protein
MVLENLIRTHQLQPHEASDESLSRLLASIRRNLSDAETTGISDETRFDAAYKAIMQCAMAGLWASGYRPATSMPGHHQTMIQTLSLTLGLPRERWLLLDTFRRKRNLNDYTGDIIETGAMLACLEEAKALHVHLLAWLQSRRPACISDI